MDLIEARAVLGKFVKLYVSDETIFVAEVQEAFKEAITALNQKIAERQKAEKYREAWREIESACNYIAKNQLPCGWVISVKPGPPLAASTFKFLDPEKKGGDAK